VTGPRITRLIGNDELHRVERLRLAMPRRFTNRSRGENLVRRGGSSTEFKDFRDYVAGDDVRFVDWNAFARLARPYVKLFHEQEELHLVLLLDASASMDFGDKLLRAQQLAAAFCVMGLIGGERVSVHAANQRGAALRATRTRRGRQGMRELFGFLESVAPGGDAKVVQGIDTLLRAHRGRGVLLVLSDFLTEGALQRALDLAFGCGLLPAGIRILAPAERDPELGGDVRLVDCEDESTLDVSNSGELLELYREHLGAQERDLDRLFRRRGGRFLSVSSDLDLPELLSLLTRRGWLR
jgi:uncharacterized protein (DUF58 family)